LNYLKGPEATTVKLPKYLKPDQAADDLLQEMMGLR
jgi:hypothetical protein